MQIEPSFHRIMIKRYMKSPYFYRNKSWGYKQGTLYGVSMLWDSLVRIFTLGQWGTTWSSKMLTRHLTKQLEKRSKIL